jgi:hypothetical protein
LQNRRHRDFVETGIKSLGLVYIILVDKLERKRTLGRQRCRREDNVKMYPTETG